jgi:iron complex outermembrane recepter protein
MKTKPALTASVLALSLATAAYAEDGAFVAAPGLLRDRPLEEMSQWSKPAAGDLRDADDYVDNYANDAGDAFFFAPGVSINYLDLAEPRIIMRGFGVGNRTQRSTVNVFRDGAPLTDIHGDTNLAEVDLLAVSQVEIYRGGGGDLKFVGDNLGGAVNFLSPTGRTARDPFSARFDAGVTTEAKPGGQAHAEFAAVAGDFDYFASVTGRYETGFRDNNQRIDTLFYGNLGYEFSPSFRTRFFLDASRSDDEYAGGLNGTQLADDPFQDMPAITLGPLFPGGPIIEFAGSADESEIGRKLTTARMANVTNFDLFGVAFEGGGHYLRRDVFAPQIDYAGIIDENGSEWGVNLAARRNLRIWIFDTDLRVGGTYGSGSKDVDWYENLDGETGDLTAATIQKSKRLTAFAEAAINPISRLVVDLGVKFINVERTLTADGGAETADYTGIAAQGGATYQLAKAVQVFVNAARSYEPPSFGELASGDPEDLIGLEEQDTFSYEAGLRGRINDWVGWDIAYFNTSIENEIVNVEEPETNGFGDALVNADKTRHKGVEAGVDINLFPGSFARNGNALTLRGVYNYNDFRFVDFGFLGVDGNRMAGLPQHVYRGELRYASGDKWFAAVNVQMSGGAYYADHENETPAPDYTVIGFSAGYRMNDNLEIFASGENLTDEAYAAGVTPVLSQTLQNGRIYTPGVGASVYGGLRYRF